MIIDVFTSLSTVQIYDLSYVHLHNHPWKEFGNLVTSFFEDLKTYLHWFFLSHTQDIIRQKCLNKWSEKFSFTFMFLTLWHSPSTWRRSEVRVDVNILSLWWSWKEQSGIILFVWIWCIVTWFRTTCKANKQQAKHEMHSWTLQFYQEFSG